MGLDRISIGDEGALRAILDWKTDYGSDGPVGRSWGDLQLWIADTLVWGQLNRSGYTEGIAWGWVDLLEFLGNAWPYLIEEEQHPISFDTKEDEPSHLGELWGRAKIRWLKLAEEEVDREDALLRDFMTVHDLASALHGAVPPNLLFLRQGEQMVVATKRKEWILSFGPTMATLESLAEAIGNRLKGLEDERSKIACSRWDARNSMSKMRRLEIATGRDESSIVRIWPRDLEEAANDKTYELKAAARMIGRNVSDDQLKLILTKINDLPKGRRLSLGGLRTQAVETVKENEGADFLQGYLLATWLREHLKCKSGRVDPKEVLVSWKVSIQEFKDETLPLDAIAVWGAEHAPVILLNVAGPRAHHPSGTLSTLAHEICHILVDADSALPVVEVLGGSVPRTIERRANAFAAEFLLPRLEAGICAKNALNFIKHPEQRRLAIDEVITTLVETYGASHETTAWQIRNSGVIELDDRNLVDHLNKHLKSIYDPF